MISTFIKYLAKCFRPVYTFKKEQLWRGGYAMQGLSTADLRRLNRTRVFRTIYEDGPITKQDLAAKTGTSLPTVTQNLKDLFGAQLLCYDGTEESTGGRKPQRIALNAQARFAVGMELSPRHVRLMAVDLKGREIRSEKVFCPFADTAAYRTAYSALLEAFLDDLRLPRSRLLGVGLTLPAVIQQKAAVIETAPVLHLRDVPLAQLTEQIPYTVFVQNDASAGAAAERRKNPRLQTAKAVAYLFLAKGVGGALLMKGSIYEGMQGRSGEFGHMCIVPGGAPCACGKRGCLEAYCSTARLTDDLGLDLADFFARLDSGAPRCRAVWQTYLDHLAQGLNMIYTAMDCEIILGGPLSPYLKPYLPQLMEKVQALNSFGGGAGRISVSQCSEEANCIGAAMHFVDAFVQSI